MARSIAEIYNQITTTYVDEAALVGIVVDPSTWGLLNRKRLWGMTQAFAIWIIEKFFDTHKQETDDKIARLKPHSARWYAEIAKTFQYGYNLVPETDYYDNTGLTEAEVAASKIITHCAVVEVINGRGLRVKVAKTVGGVKVALSAPELLAFKEFMARVKDAGVYLNITTGAADSIKLKVDLSYNPLVLDATGQRLDGTNSTPVQSGIDLFCENLPFNGVFIVEFLEQYLKNNIDGVVIAHVSEAKSQYGALPYSLFAFKYTPDAGYLRVYDAVADLDINWIPQSAI